MFLLSSKMSMKSDKKLSYFFSTFDLLHTTSKINTVE